MRPERTSHGLRAARANRRPPRRSATLMALAIIFAVAAVFVLREPPSIPTPKVQSIQGTYAWRAQGQGSADLPRETGGFSAAASGDAAGTLRPYPLPTRRDDPRPLRSSYDAKLRTEFTTSTFLGHDVTRSIVGAWPPAWQVGTPSPLDFQGLAAIVRAAVEDGDHSVGFKPLKDGERKVWRAAMTLDGKDIELVVDQLTGIVVWYSDGRSAFTATVDWTAPPPAGEAPAMNLPAAQNTTTQTDEGLIYDPSPAAAGGAAGFTPLASDLAPDGFALRAVATWRAGGAPGTWLVHDVQSGPIDRLAGQSQVAQFYTRGLSWFTMQQLGPGAAGKSVATLHDMMASLAANKLSFETTTLQYGALAGTTAYTWYDTSGPTLFVSDAQHIVYITGALTRQEVIAFAEGLKPAGSGASASPSPSP
jgi:hypothetical protein